MVGACLEPPETPFYHRCEFPIWGTGRARYACVRLGVVPSGLPGGDGVLLGGFGLICQWLWFPVVRREGVGRVDFGRVQGSVSSLEDGHHSSLPEK